MILGKWFEPSDVIERVVAIEAGQVGNRRRLGDRLEIANPGGKFAVEQQAFLEIADDKITWLRLVCSGFVPAPADERTGQTDERTGQEDKTWLERQ